MKKEIDRLSDELGLELDENGDYVIRIFDEDIDIVAETLSYNVLRELLNHQVSNENYEGAETLKQVIKRKDEIQKVQRH